MTQHMHMPAILTAVSTQHWPRRVYRLPEQGLKPLTSKVCHIGLCHLQRSNQSSKPPGIHNPCFLCMLLRHAPRDTHHRHVNVSQTQLCSVQQWVLKLLSNPTEACCLLGAYVVNTQPPSVHIQHVVSRHLSMHSGNACMVPYIHNPQLPLDNDRGAAGQLNQSGNNKKSQPSGTPQHAVAEHCSATIGYSSNLLKTPWAIHMQPVLTCWPLQPPR
jgi:hypothetical protein